MFGVEETDGRILLEDERKMLANLIKHNIPYSLSNKGMYRDCNKKVNKGYTQVTYPIWMKAKDILVWENH